MEENRNEEMSEENLREDTAGAGETSAGEDRDEKTGQQDVSEETARETPRAVRRMQETRRTQTAVPARKTKTDRTTGRRTMRVRRIRGRTGTSAEVCSERKRKTSGTSRSRS